jgi:hypothetical protein
VEESGSDDYEGGWWSSLWSDFEEYTHKEGKVGQETRNLNSLLVRRQWNSWSFFMITPRSRGYVHYIQMAWQPGSGGSGGQKIFLKNCQPGILTPNPRTKNAWSYLQLKPGSI